MCITVLEFLQSILEDTIKLEEKKNQKEIERSWNHTTKKNRQFDKSLIIYL